MPTLEEAITLDDRIITIKDARACYRGCIPGWRTFAERHGYDWPTVVRHGLKASELYATKDAMALKILRNVYDN